jgi:hypothetical protein
MRRILLVAMLAVSTAQALASEIDGGSLLFLGDGATFEQLLSGTSGTGVEGLSPDRRSLSAVDSVFDGVPAAPETSLADEVQSLLVRASAQDRQMQETQPDPVQNRSADSRNSTIIHDLVRDATMDDPTHAVASKGDLASTLGVKGNLSVSFDDANPLEDDLEGEPLFTAIRLEAPGVAIAVLFALWSLMAAVVILVHYKQKAEQRRDVAILQSFSRKRVQSVPNPVYPEERALQARPDAYPAHGWRMKNRTANINIDQGQVHAA